MREEPRRYGILRYSQGPAGTPFDGFDSRWGYQENPYSIRVFLFIVGHERNHDATVGSGSGHAKTWGRKIPSQKSPMFTELMQRRI